MFETTKALVLREVKYKEADRILTLFTADNGKITAKARGALRRNSRTAAATQQLSWSDMTLFFNKGKWTVNEASVIEAFDGLKGDIAAFALGSYFAECVEALSVEDQKEPELLSLALNSLWALSRGLHDPRKIKAAFELRLMSLSGYLPSVDRCAVCGAERPDEPVFDLLDGRLFCRRCCTRGSAVSLDDRSLEAMRYILSAPPKQIFSFALAGDALVTLGFAAENYLLAQTERSFGTLEYYKQFKTD
ncbi:MAG: DNA repair protein RecO [Oscillospiraceae bacterium]|nr:DNA repair protein RecO [Oscillospiraceae bacterium]